MWLEMLTYNGLFGQQSTHVHGMVSN